MVRVPEANGLWCETMCGWLENLCRWATVPTPNKRAKGTSQHQETDESDGDGKDCRHPPISAATTVQPLPSLT